MWIALLFNKFDFSAQIIPYYGRTQLGFERNKDIFKYQHLVQPITDGLLYCDWLEQVYCNMILLQIHLYSKYILNETLHSSYSQNMKSE